MKTFATTFFCSLFCIGALLAQTNKEIAGVYIKKAEVNLEQNDLETAEQNFDKAVKLLGNQVKDERIDRLGAIIKFNLEDYSGAQNYAKHYFTLAKNKTSEEYTQQLELFVEIGEKLDSVSQVNTQLEAQRVAHLKEIERVKSLKEEWTKKSLELSLKIDDIKGFDINGIGVFKQNNFYGIINDKAEELIEATKYKGYRFFEGYVLLLDDEKSPTEILCFNTKTKEKYTLPNVSTFNNLATHYGVVTQPRGNNKLVMYPNNAGKTLIFDLKTKEFVTLGELKPILKNLKARKHIDSFNKKGKIKVNKQSYIIDNSIDASVYTLYNEDFSFYGYLFLSNKSVVAKEEIGYLGSSYHNQIEASKNDISTWIQPNKSKTKAPDYKNGNYSGGTTINTLKNGVYQFKNDNYIILGNKKLEPLKDYLIKNNVSNNYLIN